MHDLSRYGIRDPGPVWQWHRQRLRHHGLDRLAGVSGWIMGFSVPWLCLCPALRWQRLAA